MDNRAQANHILQSFHMADNSLAKAQCLATLALVEQLEELTMIAFHAFHGCEEE